MQQNHRLLPRGPIIALLVVIVLVLLLVVGLLGAKVLWPGDDEPTSSPTPTSSTPMRDPLIKDDLKVTVGEGGSAKSADDPSLPVGYEPTCKGAVEAATNYLIALDPTKVMSGKLTEKQYLAVLRDRGTTQYSQERVEQAKGFLKSAGDERAKLVSVHPEWGGFSVVKCDEGKSATIDIVSASSFDGKNYFYSADRWKLEWVDEDWRLAGGGDAESPVTLPENDVTEPDQQVLTIISTQSQWESYEDAP